MRKSAVLYRMVMPEHICPSGLKALDLLRQRGFEVSDQTLESREATDAFKAEQGVETTPQVFIDGTRIGGFDALKEHLGIVADDPAALSYAPVIATFGMTASMAVATLLLGENLDVGAFLYLFVAYSMCLLAVYKLRDPAAFADQFITYDLLAMRWLRYARIYPYAEAFVGIGMLAGAFAPVVGGTAFAIGSVGTVSVVKAVYIDRRSLQCACVGGDSKVPLGFISLTENLMMIGMGASMMLAFT